MFRRKMEWISASEVAEYAYCPVAWYQGRMGMRPAGHMRREMRDGREMHRAAGASLSRSHQLERFSGILRIAGGLMMLLSVIGWFVHE
ncbi:hypothetical protein [Methanothrix sp.]|uniref:hypothetical protein n=1 Tax=Methanothrix sp. TaxID=90426 RepID=UPI002C5979D5|nr:hypothetical protein [Methanothrix sp.]HOK57723.1 hypothetical protein [Methanothrix sp.]HOL43126.1 hypothetical protein [Methanothrix sp.]HPO88128.1 hypothetical protein [Methanothrix sp.]